MNHQVLQNQTSGSMGSSRDRRSMTEGDMPGIPKKRLHEQLEIDNPVFQSLEKTTNSPFPGMNLNADWAGGSTQVGVATDVARFRSLSEDEKELIFLGMKNEIKELRGQLMKYEAISGKNSEHSLSQGCEASSQLCT